jgi:guanine nucleotide-binding protein G(i) subunit alpha
MTANRRRHLVRLKARGLTSLLQTPNLCEVLFEEVPSNRMMETLVYFDSIVNSRSFMKTTIILFFANVTGFKQKLAKSPLNRHFPEYSGGNDDNRAAKHLLWRFNQANRAHLKLFPHFVELTDTSNMRLVYTAIKETILHRAVAGFLNDQYRRR